MRTPTLQLVHSQAPVRSLAWLGLLPYVMVFALAAIFSAGAVHLAGHHQCDAAAVKQAQP